MGCAGSKKNVSVPQSPAKEEAKKVVKEEAKSAPTQPKPAAKPAEVKPSAPAAPKMVQNSQVGGHPGTIMFEGDKMLKKTKRSELTFWEWLYSRYNQNPDMQTFKEFIPKYYGIEERNGCKCLCLENLLHGYDNANYMDVKLGKVTWAPHKEEAKIKSQEEKNKTTTTGTLGFRITGCFICSSQGECIEDLNKGYSGITTDKVVEYFAKIASCDGELKKDVVQKFIDCTQKLLDWFKKQRFRTFIASSLFYVHGKNGKCQVKYIDFANVGDAKGEEDSNVVEGLENVLVIWKKLLNA